MKGHGPIRFACHSASNPFLLFIHNFTTAPKKKKKFKPRRQVLVQGLPWASPKLWFIWDND